MCCGEMDGMWGDILGVVIIAFMAAVLNFSDLTCARRVSGWMGCGWHRKCEWAAEELQVVVAQEMQVGAGGVSAQEV